MLDAYIIEQIKRERQKKQWEPVPLELPLPSPLHYPETADESDDDVDDRGVVIIEPDGQVARF